MTHIPDAKPADQRGSVLHIAARPFVVFVERYYPDPFVFVIALTFVAFGAVFLLTPSSVETAVVAWGSGMSSLMAFTAQIAITLIVANAFAATDAVQGLLSSVARLPRSDWQAYVLLAVAAGIASLIAWPLGLVVGATLAKRVAAEAPASNLRLHYPLLVASAYSGFIIWHMGYTGSAPLFMATPGHAMEAQAGIIPVTATIFAWWNMVLAAFVLGVVSVICALMRPPAEQIKEIDPRLLQDPHDPVVPSSETMTFGVRLTHSRLGSSALGGLLLLYMAFWFADRGFSLDLNIVNWSFLTAGLLLSRSPGHYIDLVTEGGRSLGPLLLQYPFYAGIMGLMAGSGMIDVLSNWIVEHSSQTTLPIWGFLSAGFVNMFVPSGGGQWAVQGPVFVEAALKLDVDLPLIIMAVAYGDQWTNMIQPFWTIPLLVIAGLSVRDVMGYTFITLLVTGVVFVLGLLTIGSVVA